MISELTWKFLICWVLWTWKWELKDVSVWGWAVLLVVVITAGFLEIGFILSQAALDRYVRVAEIAANEVQETLEKTDSKKR